MIASRSSGEAGRHAFEHRDESLSVRLTGGEKTQHTRLILYELFATFRRAARARQAPHERRAAPGKLAEPSSYAARRLAAARRRSEDRWRRSLQSTRSDGRRGARRESVRRAERRHASRSRHRATVALTRSTVSDAVRVTLADEGARLCRLWHPALAPYLDFGPLGEVRLVRGRGDRPHVGDYR